MAYKILILGGGRAQIGLIKTAKKSGFYTIVVGIEGDYPGYKIADKVYYVDVNDKEQILNIAINENIDGICLVCTEIGLKSLGYVCDKLGFKGPSERSAELSSNKLKSKIILFENNIKTSPFKIIHRWDSLQELKDICKELHFPVMAKAIDLQGSRGIIKCNDVNELNKSKNNIFNLTSFDELIVEEFIDGEELGAQAYIYEGEILFIQPHGDKLFNEKNRSIPIGHYMPFVINNKINEQIKEIVTNSIIALGFDNCAVNVDLIIKDDKIYILELSCRAGANMLPELTGAFLGLNYYNFILEGALGHNPKHLLDNESISSDTIETRQLFSNESGKITEIKIIEDPSILLLDLFVSKNNHINEFNSSNDCIGSIMCKGKNIEDCSDKINKFISNNLSITLE